MLYMLSSEANCMSLLLWFNIELEKAVVTFNTVNILQSL